MRRAKEIERLRVAQEREIKKMEAKREKEKKAEERKKVMEDKRRSVAKWACCVYDKQYCLVC
jgi:hypothetical protein